MQFLAHIRRGSTIDLQWRRHHRRGGDIAGVTFGLVNHVFVAGVLSDDQVRALHGYDSVVLEALKSLPDIAMPPANDHQGQAAAAADPQGGGPESPPAPPPEVDAREPAPAAAVAPTKRRGRATTKRA